MYGLGAKTGNSLDRPWHGELESRLKRLSTPNFTGAVQGPEDKSKNSFSSLDSSFIFQPKTQRTFSALFTFGGASLHPWVLQNRGHFYNRKRITSPMSLWPGALCASCAWCLGAHGGRVTLRSLSSCVCSFIFKSGLSWIAFQMEDTMKKRALLWQPFKQMAVLSKRGYMTSQQSYWRKQGWGHIVRNFLEL